MDPLSTPPPLPIEPPTLRPAPHAHEGVQSQCQGCGAVGPVKQVMFFQHIGAVVLMFNQHVKGQMCRNCINDQFSRRTLVTSFFGWWGIISFILTPFFLLHNTIRYLLCLGLKPAADQPMRKAGLATAAAVVACVALVLLGCLLGGVFGKF